MAPVKCPAPDCRETFQEDLDPTVLLRLLDLHAQTAHPPTVVHRPVLTTAKPEKVRHPVISSGGTSEDWVYFIARWTEYKRATQLQANDVVLQ